VIRVAIHGFAAVFTEDEQVTDPVILSRLNGLAYDEEVFTDYLGGSPEEEALAAALERSGTLAFSYAEGDDLLGVVTEYRAKRQLTEAEVQLLVKYTMGQWSDGIGENFTCLSAEQCGHGVMCLETIEGDSAYPRVEIIES